MRSNWTVDQIFVMCHALKDARPNYERLAATASRHGPRRGKTGARAKFENIRSGLCLNGHAGLKHCSSLEKMVLSFRINDPQAFEHYCQRLAKRARKNRQG